MYWHTHVRGHVNLLTGDQHVLTSPNRELYERAAVCPYHCCQCGARHGCPKYTGLESQVRQLRSPWPRRSSSSKHSKLSISVFVGGIQPAMSRAQFCHYVHTATRYKLVHSLITTACQHLSQNNARVKSVKKYINKPSRRSESQLTKSQTMLTRVALCATTTVSRA